MTYWSLDDLFPGDPAGLPSLYEAVPAAEERDLLDEALEAEHREHLARLWDEMQPRTGEPDTEDETLRLLRKAFNAVVILEYDER